MAEPVVLPPRDPPCPKCSEAWAVACWSDKVLTDGTRLRSYACDNCGHLWRVTDPPPARTV